MSAEIKIWRFKSGEGASHAVGLQLSHEKNVQGFLTSKKEIW